MMTPKIYIAQDPVLEEVLDTATDRLRAEGWSVARRDADEEPEETTLKDVDCL